MWSYQPHTIIIYGFLYNRMDMIYLQIMVYIMKISFTI